MKTTEHGSVREPWSRLGASLCLVAWLSGQVQLLPSLLALAAMSDPSHSVYVGLDQGKFTLVLRHEAGRPRLADYKPQCDPSNPAHHHGLIAQCVCALSSGNDRAPDHVACFSASLAAEDSPTGDTPKARAVEHLFLPEANPASSTRSSVSARLPQREAHAPPGNPFPLLFLQSVSLLV